jgi:hypothetical protein
MELATCHPSRQVAMEIKFFTVDFPFVDPQYGTCCMSPYWRLQFLNFLDSEQCLHSWEKIKDFLILPKYVTSHPSTSPS